MTIEREALPDNIKQDAADFVNRVHHEIFEPKATAHDRAHVEAAVRDAMLLRVKLCETRAELQEVLKQYTSPNGGVVYEAESMMPW